MGPIDSDGAAFEAHGPLFFSLAYRMFGSATEAEDVVQDAWLRARQDEHSDVRSARAYLTTIVTRLVALVWNDGVIAKCDHGCVKS
jgi:RNA polymerase sigma-70 factor, ECF subfamily